MLSCHSNNVSQQVFTFKGTAYVLLCTYLYCVCEMTL